MCLTGLVLTLRIEPKTFSCWSSISLIVKMTSKATSATANKLNYLVYYNVKTSFANQLANPNSLALSEAQAMHHSSICLIQVCLEHSIFIFLTYL